MFSNIPNHILARCKVLVVDDDPPSLMVAMILLSNYGAQIITANNGQEAFDLLAVEKPTFILSDLSMPVMSGWTLIERLKETETTAAIPIIALTAHTMSGDRERALEAGFDNYLAKPLTPSTFIHDLLNVLASIPSLAAELHLTPKETPKPQTTDRVAVTPAVNQPGLASPQDHSNNVPIEHKDS
jgi:two-component system, cell cycle response regulator DivK